MAEWRLRTRSLVLICMVGIGSWAAIAEAQVTPDATLGSEASRITEGMVHDLPADLIEGGAIRGSSLFHSFSAFNVGELQRLYFANPTGIDNILSRVTGDSASNILGTLGVDGSANLYLLNPNGIVFGPNARLDIAGSFFASTADAIELGNGDLYSAVNPDLPPVLAVNITPGLQYSADQRAIASTANLTTGQNLTLSSGNLTLTGQLIAGHDLTLQAQDSLTIRDSVDQPFIAAAGNNLLAQGNQTVDIFALNHPESGLFSGGDMTLQSANPIIGDAHYYSHGNFSITDLEDNSGDLNSPNDPIVIANGDVVIGNYTGASLHVLAGGAVGLGNITINQVDNTAATISPNNPLPILAQLATVTLGDGSTLIIDGASQPTLDIRAGIDWDAFGGVPGNQIVPGGSLVANFQEPPTSNGILVGNIDANVENSRIFLTNRFNRNVDLPSVPILVADVSTNLDNGQAGNVVVDAFGDIFTAEIDTFIGAGGIGDAGDIMLLSEAGGIDTTAGSLVTSTANGMAGGVRLEAEGNITTANIDSFVGAGGIGRTEAIDIVSRSGSIDTTAGIISTAVEQGIAGPIRLTALGNIRTGEVSSSVNAGGDAGPISIAAGGNFSLSGNTITTRAFGAGRGGDITIRAATVDLSNLAFLEADSRGSGRGGDINLFTQFLQITDGSEILSRAFNTGDAGNITVDRLNGSPSVVVIDGVAPLQFLSNGDIFGGFSSGIFSTSEQEPGVVNPGNGGTITVNTDSLNVTNGGAISARTRTNAAGGDIRANVGTLNIESGGQILTTAFQDGAAGNIVINAANVVSITGFDPNYEARYSQLFNTKFQQFIDANQGIITDPNLLQSRARLFAIDETEKIVDPVSRLSGLQASNQLEFVENTNANGTISLVPIVNGLGAPGNISISSPVVLLSDQADLETSTYGQNDGGIISFETNFLSLTGGASVRTQNFGPGEGGGILITRRDATQPSAVFISDIVPLTTSAVTGRPEGGYSSGLVASTENVDIALIEDPYFDLSSLPENTGEGGIIVIETDSLVMTNGGVISARSRSQGNSLGILVDASEVSITNGAQILSPAYKGGQAGTILVGSQGNIEISGFDPNYEARFQAFESAYADYLTNVFVNFYGLTINEANAIVPDRAFAARQFTIDPVNAASGLQAQAGFESAGSGLIIVESSAGSLSLSNSASIDSNNYGFGDSLGILIDVAGAVDLQAGSAISSAVLPNDNRIFPIEGGLIGLMARSLSMDNSQIAVGTSGLGNAGNIVIEVEEGILAANSSSIRSLVEQTGQGNGGDVLVQANTLEMFDGSQIAAGVFRGFLTPDGSEVPGGRGTGGDITVNVADSIVLSGFVEEVDPDGQVSTIPSGFLAQTERYASGEAGSINVNTANLILENAATISARTINASNAGDINIGIGNVSFGNQPDTAGDIQLNTLFITTGASISVDGPVDEAGNILVADPGDPGNININAAEIELIEGGKIRAVTASGNNANINLTVQNYINMRGTQTSTNPSGSCDTCNEISTEAFGFNAQGGNITIRVGNGVFAQLGENSDIVANAVGSNLAANITIEPLGDGRGYVGAFTFADPKIRGRTLQSDLDASSQLTVDNGNEVVSEGQQTQAEVPTIPLDSTNLIDRRCELQATGNRSEFSVTGRGGLPTNPSDRLEESPLIDDLGPETMPAGEPQGAEPEMNAVAASPPNIIRETQGWVQEPDGSIYLYGDATGAGEAPDLGHLTCELNQS